MRVNNTLIQVVRGSLLDQNVDVIVNAANKELKPGGGICGAIYQAAGADLLNSYVKTNYPKGTETSHPVISPAFNLPHKAILHVPGPIYPTAPIPGPIYPTAPIENDPSGVRLYYSYVNSLIMAEQYKYSSIAFCSISTGIYGYPLLDATKIAVEAVMSFTIFDQPKHLRKIVFAMYGENEYNAFVDEVARFSVQDVMKDDVTTITGKSCLKRQWRY